MRPTPNPLIDKYRIVHPTLGPSEEGENYGCFDIETARGYLLIIASDGLSDEQWEHASVHCEIKGSGRTVCPNWEEMAMVKDLFWDDEETVFQFHPKKSAYVNCHPHTLHLWRKRGINLELPPTILI